MEFNARKWETPANGAPCITGIEVTHNHYRKRATTDMPLVIGSKSIKLSIFTTRTWNST